MKSSSRDSGMDGAPVSLGLRMQRFVVVQPFTVCYLTKLYVPVKQNEANLSSRLDLPVVTKISCGKTAHASPSSININTITTLSASSEQ